MNWYFMGDLFFLLTWYKHLFMVNEDLTKSSAHNLFVSLLFLSSIIRTCWSLVREIRQTLHTSILWASRSVHCLQLRDLVDKIITGKRLMKERDRKRYIICFLRGGQNNCQRRFCYLRLVISNLASSCKTNVLYQVGFNNVIAVFVALAQDMAGNLPLKIWLYLYFSPMSSIKNMDFKF